MYQKNIVYIEQLKLKGNWYSLSLEEAFNGMISNFNLDFLQKNPLTNYFYGITVFKQKNQLDYFIGTVSSNNNLDFSNYNFYKINKIETENIQEIYLDLMNKDLNLLLLFDADKKVNPIPIRIERYTISNNVVEIDEILIPIIK